MAQKYKAEYPDLSWVAVSANDALQYPEDGPGPMQMWAQTQGGHIPIYMIKISVWSKHWVQSVRQSFILLMHSARLLI